MTHTLIEITGDIFTKLDENNEPLVEKILDTAGQKGTGKLYYHQMMLAVHLMI
jgi:6-phosphogluconate dehydrogenase